MDDAPRRPHVLAVRRDGDEAEIDLAVPPELFWFRGHFPGRPILPGVVQIEWALALARERLGVGLPSGQALRVKFRAVVRPDDRVTLALRRLADGGGVEFEYSRGGEVCSSGRIGGAP